ncbi:Structural maintenance of chromosomes protein 4, partial [Exophiala xenobiotica]
VMPPKKSWKNTGNLSGGEKTLSSLALVFALHVYRPTPLYVRKRSTLPWILE